MNDDLPDIIALWEDRRRLAIAMLEGFKAGAFERPHTAEDVAYFEAELAECEANLAAARRA